MSRDSRRTQAMTRHSTTRPGREATAAAAHPGRLNGSSRACLPERSRPDTSRALGSALAAVIALSFLVLCVAPAIPLLRLGTDAVDLYQRLNAVQRVVSAGPSSLLNVASLDDLQSQVDAIRGDLRELDSASNLLLAPIAAASPHVRSYRLLLRMGMDLVSAGDDGVSVIRLLLAPVESATLAAASPMPALTTADLSHARELLRDAAAHISAALMIYQASNTADLPAILRPGGRYGKLLARLPQAVAFLGDLNGVLDAAPALLGIDKPAFYLVTAMDRSELRPIGGLMGNYGILALDGGRQMAQDPLSLHNTYSLDNAYYLNPLLNSDPNPGDTPTCLSSGPQPPASYWWWPIRDFSCQYGWGLRDAGLSPDFPTNARMDMAIAEAAGVMPGGAPLQGMIAFTPAPIEAILKLTGPVAVPGFNTAVSANSLERLIHDYQLADPTALGQDRKEFTHQLSIALLARLRSLHGGALKSVVQILAQALRDKEIEVYFSDPRVEGLLQRLDLAATIATGNGDGFYVVDTNDGGNKANLYVSEQQTDIVTVLPDGSVLHHLRIAITYDKTGPVFEGSTGFEDYSDVQRTYLPADAEILDYAGYTPPIFVPAQCGGGGYASPITNCDPSQALVMPVTASDVPGRTMVMGPVLVTCGGITSFWSYDPTTELATCRSQPVAQTINLYVTWLTPHAVILDAQGRGSYHELVQKQPGSNTMLSVYLIRATTSVEASAASALALGKVDLPADAAARETAFDALLASATPIYAGQLAADTTITYHV